MQKSTGVLIALTLRRKRACNLPTDIALEQFELESFMEDEDDKAIDGLRKCEHGVRIAKGDSAAVYCSGCTPGHGRIMSKSRVAQVTHNERTLDAAEYAEQPLSERFAFAAQMEDISA